MSDELDLDGEERRLSELFGAVPAPDALRGRWMSPGGRAPGRRVRRLAARMLIGAPGERRLRPLAAALLVPVLVLAIAGGFGLRARLSSSGGPAANPPGRANAAMAWDASGGDVVMFGGNGLNGVLHDTWTWDGSGWTERHPSISPPPLNLPVMASDPATGRVLLVGAAPSAQGAIAETWTWDGSTWQRAHPGHQPPANGAQMAGDPATHQVVLVALPFPGMPGALQARPAQPGQGVASAPSIAVPQPAVQTWTWNGSDWTVRSTAPPSTLAAPRLRLAWDQSTKRVVMLSTPVSCGVAYASGGGSAAAIPHPVPVPPAPSGTTGSAGSSGTVPPVSPPPRPAATHAPSQAVPVPLPMMTSPPHPVITPVDPPMACSFTVEDGGAGGAVHPTALCSVDCPHTTLPATTLSAWSGSSWRDVTPKTMPVLGGPERLIEDPAGGGLLVTGSFGAPPMWTVTAGSWHALGTPSSAAALGSASSAAIAGDLAHHDVVLFGGAGPGGLRSDTWTWDGKTWTHRAGPLPVAPTPNFLHGVPGPVQVEPAPPVRVPVTPGVIPPQVAPVPPNPPTSSPVPVPPGAVP